MTGIAIFAALVIFFVLFFALKPRFWKPKRDIAIIHLINRRPEYIKYEQFPDSGKIERAASDGTTENYYFQPQDIEDDPTPKIFRTKYLRYLDFWQGNPFAVSHRKISHWLEWQRLMSGVDTDQTLSTMSGNEKGRITLGMALAIAGLMAGMVGAISFMIGFLHP